MSAAKSSRPDRAKKWVFALIPVFFLIASAEFLIRWTGAAKVCAGGEISSVLVCDPLLHFKINPNQIIYGEPINAAGFRGREFLSKRPNVFRILALGDSCTFGLAAPEFGYYVKMPYPRLLEKMIEVKHGPDVVEVLNAGSPGYNSFQGLTLLRTKLRKLEPDLITVRFGWNDHLMSATTTQSSHFRESPNPVLRGLRATLMRSAIYQYFSRLKTELGIHRQGKSELSRPSQWQPAMSIADYKYALRKIAELGRDRGALVWFLTAPQAFRDAEGIARYEALPLGAIGRRILKHNHVSTFERMHEIHESYTKATREVARDLTIPLVDMAALFERVELDSLFSMEDGLHPSPQGHRLEAGALYRRLVGSGALDRS